MTQTVTNATLTHPTINIIHRCDLLANILHDQSTFNKEVIMTQPTNKELFNTQAEFNKWLKELTEDEKNLVITLMDEARELGYDKGVNDEKLQSITK